MTEAAVSVPHSVRVAVAHAATTQIADEAGIKVLHIKGPALDPEITWPGREGTDADVLVRESDSRALVTALQHHGWQLRSRFENSSSFQHSATLWHDLWGFVDVHRYFPGIGERPDKAFEVLWAQRASIQLAGVPCEVPSVPGQILIVMLHAARSGGGQRAENDIRAAWGNASAVRRAGVIELVTELKADVGFAAATGRLDEYRGAPDYDLWVVASRGGTRFQEWRARVKAAPSRRAAIGVLLRAPLVNTDHLAMVRGHPPSPWEVFTEFFARPARGVAEIARTRFGRPRATAPGPRSHTR